MLQFELQLDLPKNFVNAETFLKRTDYTALFAPF